MATDESALVLVGPDDNIDAIVSKVRGAGAANVELLVPEGTPVLQALGGFARLRQSLERDRIGLLVISSDEKTLNAARLNQFDTLGVQGAKVTFPSAPINGGRSANPYATQVLPVDPADRAAGVPLSEQDSRFLDELDQVPARDRYADVEDADLYAALDDLSDAIQGSAAAERRTRSADDDFAAALDEWSELSSSEREGARLRDESAAPRERVRVEDIELSDEDLRRQRGSQRNAALRDRSMGKAGATAAAAGAGRRRGTRSDRMLELEEYEEALPRRRRTLPRWLPIVVLLAIVLILVALYLSMRTNVMVTPAAAAGGAIPFTNEIIPLVEPDSSQSTTAVQAVPVNAEAEATVQGQVASEVMAPTGTARGVVRVTNTAEAPLELPANTEFLATNDQGQEVRFAIEAPVTVPPAVTTSSETGRSTTYGQIDVPVVARSPGSASNVGENVIKQILIPGQQPLVSDVSNFLLRNAPITGGDEQPQRIVTQEEVQAVLGKTLSDLYYNGVLQLRGQIDESRLGIDEATVSPSPQELGSPERYELVAVDPAVGQPVDPNNPIFTVTVRGRFNALATPRDKPVHQQLRSVVSMHFDQSRRCNQGNQPAPRVEQYRWDGTSLTINGELSCISPDRLSPEVMSREKAAVLGRSREEADANLRELKEQGLIGDYYLPDKAQFPRFDFLVSVEEGAPAPIEQQPAVPTGSS